MNGIHDMGGMHGFGPIVLEEDEPVFHYPWEGRVYAMRTQTRVTIPGGSRFAIERMGQALYLASSYYERWLHASVQSLIEIGVFSQAEFEDRLVFYRSNPQATPPTREDPAAVQRALANIHTPQSRRSTVEMHPAFAIGDAVVTKNMHPAGHTRLPRYARGKRGIVVSYYGVQDFDDALSAGAGPQPQPLYGVRFEGQELWGEFAEANTAIHLDMWESYLVDT